MKNQHAHSTAQAQANNIVMTTIVLKEVDVRIEPLNKKGLARLLGVTPFILNKMIESCKNELGEPTGTMYCQKQVQYMINRYGRMSK
jgi:hypothetical protein